MAKRQIRKTNKSLTTAERIAIGTMAAKGTSISQMARSLDRERATVRSAVEQAKELLNSNAIFYAERHLEATAIAAKDGNSKPAEWALERLKVVDPVKTVDTNGFSVSIGLVLPGLGSGPALVNQLGAVGQVIDAETVTKP